jgi:dTDP-4-amino-4,6-dideoxygalactose transaminase
VRSTFLPYHLPSIGPAEIDAVVQTLESGWLTTGPRTKQFESDFAAMVGADHAIAVNSCTAALHLALDAAGVSRGDEVVVPTMTFAATAEVVVYFGATPVLVDCQRETCNVDPEAIERALTPRTRAIVPVHYAGQPCDMGEIMALGRRTGVMVVEDAAHALPASYRGTPIGRIGDITCFSFYATKTLSTGEGGMITTNDAAAADRMRLMSLHGISKDAWKRYTAEGSWYYEILQPGFKYNLTDIAAALGLAQLKRQAEFLTARQRIAQRYDDAFARYDEIRCPTRRADREHAWHLYAIELDVERLTLSRGEFIEAMRAEGIGTSVHFIPLHLHPYYRERFNYRDSDFPNAFAAYQHRVSLPIYPAMTDDDVQDVIRSVDAIVGRQRSRSTIAVAAAATAAPIQPHRIQPWSDPSRPNAS